MASNLFSKEQIELIKQNPYTRYISSSTLSFTKSFKDRFWDLYLENLPLPDIFTELGYDPQLLGQIRMNNTLNSIKKLHLQDAYSFDKEPRIGVGGSQISNLNKSMNLQFTALNDELAEMKKELRTIKKILKELQKDQKNPNTDIQ